MHTYWVEINLQSIIHNFEQIRELVGPSVKIMAVVKADAYGHGAVETSRALSAAGTDYLAVTTLEEALELREAAITTPALVFSPLLPDQLDAALDADLDLTVSSPDTLNAISDAAARKSKKARIHVKLDTGMGRLGMLPSECLRFIPEAAQIESIEIAGIYTHFANAGAKDLSSAREQNAAFRRLVDSLKGMGLPTGLCHAANSSAILNLPDSRYDMVRPGTILYGQFPTAHTERKIKLEDTWQLKTRVVALRSLPTGAKVGYGSEFTTSRPTKAAVIPIGYCDGFTMVPESVARRAASPLRQLAGRILRHSARVAVTIRGHKAPVIGRVSMQMTTVDVTGIPEVQIGDEVTVPARRTTTSSRIPRVYL